VDGIRIGLFLGLLFRMLHVWALRRRHQGHPGKSVLKFFKDGLRVFFALQALFWDIFPISRTPSDLTIITGLVIYSLGLVITVAGRMQLKENWSDLENYQILPMQSLVTGGIYRYIRHPVYTGDFLLFVGLELALNSWLILGALIIIPIMVRQASLEETLLTRAFPHYQNYCLNTKRFIPFIL
jgi:protein-S-isoprenylcysteine O-methyltransferase Ste14